MINELYELSQTMRRYHIGGRTFAQNYHEVSYKACVCVCMSKGHISRLSPITQTQKTNVRNYTETSSGGFPCVKLAPLYRVADKSVIQIINMAKKKPELLDASKLMILQENAVLANSNWDAAITRKCENAHRLASKIRDKVAGDSCAAFEELWQEFDTMQSPQMLHAALTKAALAQLEVGNDIALMLDLLFYCGNKGEDDGEKKNGGEMSILFDAEGLYELGMPVTSAKFTNALNEALLASERKNIGNHTEEKRDAFGCPYSPLSDVMPNVKIGAGFFVKTRTMNKDIPCLNKYGQEGSLSYPLAHCGRINLQQAINYISGNNNREKTWLCIDTEQKRPRDILFAYPLQLNRIPEKFAASFSRPGHCDDSSSFEERAKKLVDELVAPDMPGADSNAVNIRIFILRRLNVDNNSGRTKVVYTRQTDAFELEKCSEAWTCGCANLPTFPFGTPQTPYPLDAADVLNRFWNQKGEVVTDKFKPCPKYHGLELLMEPDLPVTSDLHRLAENAMKIGPFLGNLCAEHGWSHPIWEKTKDMLAMLGLFLSRRHIGKEQYMENLPYIYGQLLKAADELHALYCSVVRNGDIPPQLVGSSLFQSAAEAPVRTMQVLSQRIMPYYSWAKSYRLKNDKESWRAGWLYGLCEKIVAKLQENWTTQTRFSDEEKAQLFIGYLAAFPKKKQTEQNMEEEAAHE